MFTVAILIAFSAWNKVLITSGMIKLFLNTNSECF